jgi:hypothetical protein
MRSVIDNHKTLSRNNHQITEKLLKVALNIIALSKALTINNMSLEFMSGRFSFIYLKSNYM